MNVMTLMKLKVVAVGLAGWINQQQEDVIEPERGSVEEGEVGSRERLGGLLRYYYRDYRDAA